MYKVLLLVVGCWLAGWLAEQADVVAQKQTMIHNRPKNPFVDAWKKSFTAVNLIDIASQRHISRFVYCKRIVPTVVSIEGDIINKLFVHLR